MLEAWLKETISVENRPKCEEIYKKALEVTPGGVNSPIRAFLGLKMTPVVAAKAKGAILEDVDGNSFIDFCCSWGALLHGHSPDFLIDGVKEQLEKGTSYGMTTEIEEKLAHLIVSHVPGVDKIRFVNSGTEAVMTAVRIARGYTEKDIVVKFNGNYHGHSDSFLLKGGSALMHQEDPEAVQGVPGDLVKHTRSLPYNDVEVFKAFMDDMGDQVAAVVVEGVPANMGVVLPKAEFLSAIRAETKKRGALLIIDEVITGFRIGGLGGASAHFGIDADLKTFGKIIGGGFPVGAIGGKREIMDSLAPIGGVFQAGTLSGNPISMRAGYESVRMALRDGFYEELDERAKNFTDRLENAIASSSMKMCMNRIGSLFTIFFGVDRVESREDLDHMDEELFNRCFYHCFSRGVLLAPSPFEANFISTAHSEEHLDFVASVLEEFIR